LLAALAGAASAAELVLEQGAVSPGKPAALNVQLTAGAEAPTGFQFDLEFDPASLEVSAEVGPAAKGASKFLQSRMLQPGKLRVLIIGFNQNPIPDGVLAVVRVSYKGTETGKTFPVRLTASSGTNADAKPVAVTVKDGSVRVEK
jgi:hypothetical protein